MTYKKKKGSKKSGQRDEVVQSKEEGGKWEENKVDEKRCEAAPKGEPH